MISQRQLQSRIKKLHPDFISLTGSVFKMSSSAGILRLDISMFDGGVQLEFMSSDDFPPHVIIIDYFSNSSSESNPTPFTRQDIFRLIDILSETLGAHYTYIGEDVHSYTKCGNKILSRYIDLFWKSDRSVFYQRGWPGSTRVLSSQIQSIGTLDTKQTLQRHRRSQSQLLEKFDSMPLAMLEPEIVSTDNMVLMKRFLGKQQSKSMSVYEAMRKLTYEVMNTCPNETTIMLVKAVCTGFQTYFGPNELFRKIQSLLFIYFDSQQVVKIYKKH